MYEVELKAHVADRDSLVARLDSFADYCGAVHKEDCYYKHGDVKARIRTETTEDGKQHLLFTYKRKELRADADGAATEVNDEKECALSSADALTAFLADAGFVLTLRKTKAVRAWRFEGALFELCTVPPLGDFLEIELLSPTNDADAIARLQKALYASLVKAGLSYDTIEPRYYSDMIRAAQKGADNV